MRLNETLFRVVTDVLSCETLVARLVKDAFTMELVEVTEELSWDTLVAKLVKEAFTVMLVEFMLVFS